MSAAGTGVPMLAGEGVLFAKRVRAGGTGVWTILSGVGAVVQADKVAIASNPNSFMTPWHVYTKKLYQSALALHFRLC